MSSNATPSEPSPLMVPDSDQDTHVFYVEAKPRKLKMLTQFDAYNDDLRPFWGCSPQKVFDPVVIVEENDYYRSKAVLWNEDGDVELPKGTAFRLTGKEESRYVSDGSELEGFEGTFDTGVKVVMEALDPRDPDRRLQFRYWSTDQAARKRFKKITNQMEIVAIAATGL